MVPCDYSSQDCYNKGYEFEDGSFNDEKFEEYWKDTKNIYLALNYAGGISIFMLPIVCLIHTLAFAKKNNRKFDAKVSIVFAILAFLGMLCSYCVLMAIINSS
jgi:hypothetical protein